MKYNWLKVANNLILSLIIALISISLTIRYVASTSNWFSESVKLLLAGHLLIIILVMLSLIFILLQLLSKNALCKKLWDKPIEYPENDEKIYLLMIFLLTIIGFYLRIFDLNNQSFWIDETITANAAISLLTNGIPVFPSGMIYARDILNTVIVVLSFETFGINEFSGRLPSVIFGTLVIPLTYLVGKKFGNKNIGLAAAILVTFSLLDITWSRQTRMYAQLQFFFILSVYLFYLVVEERKLKYIPLLCASSLAAFLSHLIGFSLTLIFLVFLIYLVFTKVKEIKIILVYFKALLDRPKLHFVYFFIVILFAIIFFKIVYGTTNVFVSIMNIEPKYNDFYINFLVDSYKTTFYFYMMGMILLILAINNHEKALLLMISFPVYFLIWMPPDAGANLERAYNSRYLLFYTPFYYIIVVYAIEWFTKNIFDKTIFKPIINYLTIIIVILMIIAHPIGFTATPNEIYGFYEDKQKLHQPDVRTAFMYVKNQMNIDDIIISDTTGTSEALYYLGDKFRSDKNYNLYEKNLIFGKDGNKYDIYGNASIIENLTMLKDIVRTNKRGWVITQSGRGKTGDTNDFISSNMYKHLTTSENVNPSSLSLPGKVRQIDIYSWGIVTSREYSDNFDTDNWIADKYSSYGIERSKGIIHTKYVLYPNITDENTNVKYRFNFSGNIQNAEIKVTGNRRDRKHNLTIWTSKDNIIYSNIIEFDQTADDIKKADLTNYIKNNQTWIEFRFFRSSKRENMPRILDFSITAVPKDNETVEITPFRKERQNVSSVKVSRYNPTNLIKEPSFEHYKNSDKTPISWSFASDNGAQAGIDTIASAGNYSFRTSVRNATSGNADLSQLFAINGSKYLFNVSYKQTGEGNTSALIQWMDAQGKEIGNEKLYLYPNTSWNIFSFEKYIPQNTTQGKVILRYQTWKGDSGTVWFDDVQLYSAR